MMYSFGFGHVGQVLSALFVNVTGIEQLWFGKVKEYRTIYICTVQVDTIIVFSVLIAYTYIMHTLDV